MELSSEGQKSQVIAAKGGNPSIREEDVLSSVQIYIFMYIKQMHIFKRSD